MTAAGEDRPQIQSESRTRSMLIVSETWSPESDPAAVHLHERAVQWSRAGHRVQVICAGQDSSARDGITRHGIATWPRTRRGGLASRALRVWTFERGARRCVGDLGPVDVVLSSSPPLLAGAVGTLLAQRLGVPHVLEVRDLWPDSVVQLTPTSGWPLAGRMGKLEHRLYRNASAVIAMTKGIADVVRTRQAHDVRVVHGGANLEHFKPGPRCPDVADSVGLPDGPVVGYLGTIGRAQDFGPLLDAASELADAGVTILIVGSGAGHGQLERLVRRRRLGNVVMIGRRSRRDMPKLWSLCDVGLVLLRDTPVLATVRPMKMYEGMATGTPLVVSAPRGEATAWVEDAGAGCACAPGDGQALSRAIMSQMNESDHRRACADAAAKEGARWSRTRQADATIEILLDVIRTS